MTSRLTLLDLDNTLLFGDSDYEWGRFLIEQNIVDAPVYEAANRRFFEQYKAGVLDIYEFLKFQLQPLASHSRAQLDSWHAQYMTIKVLPMVTQKAKDLIAKHRAAGDLMVIVTATNSFVTRPIADYFGIDNLIATEPEQRDGEFTGKVDGTPSFREGKIERLHSWLQSQGLSWESFSEIYFYSDSLNDLPLMSLVSHPVAVDPDPTLLVHAEAHGWPVMSLRP